MTTHKKPTRGLKRGLCLAAATLVLWAGLCGCGKDGRVVAKVEGKKIYKSEIDEMVRKYVSISKKIDPAYIEPTGMVLASMRRQFIEGVIDKIVIMNKAKDLGISISDDELSVKIDLLKKNNNIMEEDAFNRYLAEQNISEAEFRGNIRDIMMMEKVRDSLFKDLKADDAEIAAHYAANKSDYAREAIKAAHVLVAAPAEDDPARGLLSIRTKLMKADKTLSGEALDKAVQAERAKLKARAEGIFKRAKAGENFAALAKKYSDGPSADAGGSLGEVARGDMVKEFDRVLFTLKKGEVAGPVETKFGFHVIKALSDPKREVKSLDDVRGEVRRAVLLEKRKARLASLREGVKIQVLWDGSD